MNKFFMRKEAEQLPVQQTGVAQGLPQHAYTNVGQPSWWEKSIYKDDRNSAKNRARLGSIWPVRLLTKKLGLDSNKWFGLGSSKPIKQFDPKDNPEAYHADLYNMAKAREARMREAAIPAHLKHLNLLEEIQRNPWRSNKLGPYMRRANHRANMLGEQSFNAGTATYRIGEPGSLEANNFIDDIKYGKPVNY